MEVRVQFSKVATLKFLFCFFLFFSILFPHVILTNLGFYGSLDYLLHIPPHGCRSPTESYAAYSSYPKSDGLLLNNFANVDYELLVKNFVNYNFMSIHLSFSKAHPMSLSRRSASDWYRQLGLALESTRLTFRSLLAHAEPRTEAKNVTTTTILDLLGLPRMKLPLRPPGIHTSVDVGA